MNDLADALERSREMIRAALADSRSELAALDARRSELQALIAEGEAALGGVPQSATETMMTLHQALAQMFQRFEGGIVFAHYVGEREVAFPVHGDVMDALPDPGDYWPVSKAVSVISHLGNPGKVQCFLVNARTDGGREAAVCSSDQFGAYVVAPEIWDYYHSIGDAQSRLGYPESSWTRTGMLSGMQRFEGGNIFWRSDIGAFAVSPHVVVSVVIGDGRGVPGKLGYPISEERVIGSGADRIQFFERGVVSLRDGKREIWLTPEQGDLEQFFSAI